MTPASKLPSPVLCLVTDRRLVGGENGLIAAVDGAVGGGVNIVQLREKDLSSSALLDLALELKGVIRGRALLLVNSDYAVAKRAGADGVHLPEYMFEQAVAARAVLGDAALIGRSAHHYASGGSDAMFIGTENVDFLVLGTIFDSRSHPSGETIGLTALKSFCSDTDMPVIGIGGIDSSNARHVVEAGAAGVAVISAILGAQDPRKAAAELMARITLGSSPSAAQ